MSRGPEVRVPAAGPLHLEATVRVLQRRPINRVDRFEDGRHLRVFATREGLRLVSTQNHGSFDVPDLRAHVLDGTASAAARRAIGATVARVLGLAHDPEALQRIARAEPRLRRIATALRGMRPPRFATLFEAFANIIPFQQVSLDSGAAIVARFVERFGRRLEHGGAVWFAFPEAGDVASGSPAALRELGLSRTKAESLHRIATLIATGALTEESLEALSTPDAELRLRELQGIGPWSAGLVMLRGFGRLDAFPRGDVGVARGLTALVGGAADFDHERFASRFGDVQGYLYFLSLGAQLLERGLIHAAPNR